MSISRVPGFSLLANLDRQGTDLSITSSGRTLTYWDVTNYEFGINTAAPAEPLHVEGNILVGNGNIRTSANLTYNIGTTNNRWATVWANQLHGTIQTNAQPNITSIGTLSSLAVSGNITANLVGNVTGTILTANQPFITNVGTLGNLTVAGNVTAANYIGNLYGNVFGNLTGTILTGNQPFITNVGTLSSLNVTGNILANNVVASTLTGLLLTNAQPNITSVGSLTDLVVTGNLTVSGITFANVTTTGNLNAGNNRVIWVADPIASTDAATKAYVDAAVTGGAKGNLIPLGSPTDGNIQQPGAWNLWTFNTTVTDAIDDLNEMLENVRANTFVKSVSFTSNVTAGGAGTTIQLTIVPTGNANSYDIAWGDGTYSNATASTSPTHTYADNTNSPFDLIVRAYNSGGVGTGSEASQSRIDYIVIYTADPNVQFDLYRTVSGGSALTGSNLWVIEGNTIYMQNTTTNTTMATVAYQMNWGDGTANVAIASDGANGGVSGSRLAYTPSYTASSGATTNTMRLFLTSHTTANPSVIPRANIANVKVYDANIGSPSTLNTKTLTFSGSVGTNATLAASAVDNTGGTTLAANASVSRTVATGTTLITTTGNVTTNYSYNANVGFLQAVVNGTVRGNVNMATQTTPVISGNLGVIGFSDFWLLTSAGAGTTFASSVYYPGRFWGFVANVVAQGGSIPLGINRFGMNSTNGGIVANVEFVKDDVTSVPTVSGGNVAIRAPGTYRYISGIPYFNTGSPQLWLQDLTVSSWIGQTWNNTANVVFVNSGTNLEGTTGNVILANTHAYVNLSNISSPMLASGTPIAGTGNVAAYNLANLTVAINQSSVRAVANIQVVATNVNGTSTARNVATRRIQVHTAAQNGISEISINVAASLGNGTITSNGIRSTYFISSAANNPTYANSTQFFTANVYSESSDPGVAGTKEATLRLGTIKHDLTDYSTAFLPVGPNRSGDTGNQFFTFAFRRYVVSNFDLNITAPSGVVGVWIAAPGTTIDNTSGLSGWLDCSTAYAGAGVPGSNTGAGGNGSNGCALTSGDRIQANTALSGGYTMTLGTENMTNATNQTVLVRVAMASGQTITSLSVGVAT